MGLVNGWVLSDVEGGWFGVYSDRVLAVKRTRSVLGTGSVGAGIGWQIRRWVLMLVKAVRRASSRAVRCGWGDRDRTVK